MASAQSNRTTCPRGHPYSAENTTYTAGRRSCRACRAEQYRRKHPQRTPAEILWARIAPGRSGCWLWTGLIAQTGYGIYDGLLAHRLMYELVIGPIPDGLTIDHVKARGCTSRSCVNPSHLEPVPLAVNVLRGDSPPARNARKTHCPAGHEYDEANTYISASGWRGCRACNRERARARARR